MEVPLEDTIKYGMAGGKMLNPRLMHVDRMVEKPNSSDSPSQLACPGRYVLSPLIFEILRKTPPGKGGEIQLTDALQTLAKTDKLFAYQFTGTRYDTGDRLGFIDATLAFALKRPDLAPGVRELMRKHLGV